MGTKEVLFTMLAIAGGILVASLANKYLLTRVGVGGGGL